MKINVKCFASLSTDDTCRHDQLRSITLSEDNATVGNLVEQVQDSRKRNRHGIRQRQAVGARCPAVGR